MGLFKNNIIHSGHTLLKDDINTKRVQVINFLVLIGTPVTVLFIFLHLGKGLYVQAALNFVMFLLFVSSFVMLRISMRYLKFSINAAFMTLLLIQIKTYIFGSIENTSFFWFFTLPTFAAILYPRHIADRWIIFMMSMMAGFYIIIRLGLFVPPYHPKILIFLFLTLTVLISIVRFSQKVQDQYEADLRVVKQELERSHKQTQDSIKYAAMIQRAVMSQEEHLGSHFEDSFLHWQPKDIVGGDIFFIDELKHTNKDEVLLMLIDCSGHGVPGALVTMLVKALERQIVTEINSSDEKVSPAKIMASFNRNMKKLLRQESSDTQDTNAGFDAAIMSYNKKTHQVKFSGSNSSLYLVKEGELSIIKGDRQSVGYRQSDVAYNFSEHSFRIEQTTTLYMTTDGYLDQNGGTYGYPFGTKRFSKIIEEHFHKPLKEQKEILLDVLNVYQDEEQTNDDIAMLGIKIIYPKGAML